MAVKKEYQLTKIKVRSSYTSDRLASFLCSGSQSPTGTRGNEINLTTDRKDAIGLWHLLTCSVDILRLQN